MPPSRSAGEADAEWSDDRYAVALDYRCDDDLDDRPLWMIENGLTDDDLVADRPQSSSQPRCQQEPCHNPECQDREHGPFRKGLCNACYVFARRHNGELPSAETVRKRRWARDAPITR